MASVLEYLAARGREDIIWDAEKNSISPDEIMPQSHKQAWWKCEKGHSWRQKVYAVSAGCGCPYCAGMKAIPGETDLATTHPELAAEWDTEKNGLDASAISAGSALNAWWKCDKGHSYRAVVYSREAGTGCPYCAGKKVLAGFNDLLTTDPGLCDEWDYGKNTLAPTQVNRGSHKKLWWRCELGHSYDAEPYARAAGNGCPYCAGRRVLAGFNDLATTHPKVAAQWAQEMNGDVTPEQISKGSNKKFWWKCSQGHYWKAAVFSRTRTKASDCPVCAGRGKVRFNSRYKPEEVKRRPRASTPGQERPAV